MAIVQALHKGGNGSHRPKAEHHSHHTARHRLGRACGQPFSRPCGTPILAPLEGGIRLVPDKLSRLSGLEGIVLPPLVDDVANLAHQPHQGNDLGHPKGDEKQHHNPNPIRPIPISPGRTLGIGVVVVSASWIVVI